MSIKSKLFDYVGQQKKKSIEIPEMAETIYFGPITVAEMDTIRTMSSVNVPGEPMPRINNIAFSIWTIIKKAEDESGEKIFTDADRPFFDQMEYSIVRKVSTRCSAWRRRSRSRRSLRREATLSPKPLCPLRPKKMLREGHGRHHDRGDESLDRVLRGSQRGNRRRVG